MGKLSSLMAVEEPDAESGRAGERSPRHPNARPRARVEAKQPDDYARLEERLERIETLLMANLTVAQPEESPRRADDLGALGRDLDQVLASIAVEQEALRDPSLGEGARREAHKTLGLLRRRQFAILFRMGPAAPGVSLDAEGHAHGF